MRKPAGDDPDVVVILDRVLEWEEFWNPGIAPGSLDERGIRIPRFSTVHRARVSVVEEPDGMFYASSSISIVNVGGPYIGVLYHHGPDRDAALAAAQAHIAELAGRGYRDAEAD